jgi:hypothetical protein
MLVKKEPMGGRKPGQLLHAMLEFCPLGMERHLSFHYFFMQRLCRPCGPSWERYSLDILAVRADHLWSVHTTKALLPTARRTLRQPA